MKQYIETRAVEIANYIVENNTTVRQAAKRFGISKSTVHKDITDADRLLRIDPDLAAQTRKILDVNKSERHIRGGLATKENMHTVMINDLTGKALRSHLCNYHIQGLNC